jgi:hypothetical protein
VEGLAEQDSRWSAQRCLCCSAQPRGAQPRYASFMAMLFARASLPAWVVVLALGAFLAPAGIVTTVLLVALGLACIPAVITAGVWKRTAAVSHREPEAIEAEFTTEDATPTGDVRGRRELS